MKWECGCEIDGQHIFTCKKCRKEISFEGLEFGLPEEREEYERSQFKPKPKEEK